MESYDDETVPFRLATYHPPHQVGYQFSRRHSLYTNNMRRLEQLPSPHTASLKKHQIFELSAHAHTDARVDTLLDVELDKPLSDIIHLITLYCGDDISKVRALYRWITSLPVKECTNKRNANADTGSYQVWLLKEKKTSFSAVFQLICWHAGLVCAIIRGYLKGSKYVVGQSVHKCRQSWNAVLINEDWYLIDALWGARTPCTSPDENYFLADPEQFIYTHCAEVPIWQLLDQPVSMEEFEEMAFLKQRYFNLDMRVLSHTKCTVDATDGVIDLLFGLNPKKHACQSFKCITKLYDDDTEIDDQLNDISRPDENTLSIKVEFPDINTYKLEILGKDDTVIDGSYTFDWVAIYKVNVMTVSCIPTAVGWGPNAFLEKYFGIVPLSHLAGEIRMIPGQLEVVFRIVDEKKIKNKNIVYKLLPFEHCCNSDEPTDDNVNDNDYADGIQTISFTPEEKGEANDLLEELDPLLQVEVTSQGTSDCFVKEADTSLHPEMEETENINQMHDKWSPVSEEGELQNNVKRLDTSVQVVQDTGLQVTYDTNKQVPMGSDIQVEEDTGIQVTEDAAIQIKEYSDKQVEKDSDIQVEEDSDIQVEDDTIDSLRVNNDILFKKVTFVVDETGKGGKPQINELSSDLEVNEDTDDDSDNCISKDGEDSLNDVPMNLDSIDSLEEVPDKTSYLGEKESILEVDTSAHFTHIQEEITANLHVNVGEFKLEIHYIREGQERNICNYHVFCEEEEDDEDDDADDMYMQRVQTPQPAIPESGVGLHALRRALQEARESENVEKLQTTINLVIRKGWQRKLWSDILMARYAVCSIKQRRELIENVKALTQRQIAEIKSYSHPSYEIHAIMKGTLLLLGNSDKETQTWKDIQALIGKTGTMSIKRRIGRMDVGSVNTATVNRVQKLLKDVKISKDEDVYQLCPAAVTFYLWTIGIVEEFERR